MIRENIHASHEQRWGIAARHRVLNGKWTRSKLLFFTLLGMLLLLLPACLALIPLAARAASSQPLISAGDWTTYGNNPARTNFTAAETTITPTSAPLLKQKWAHSATNGISDQAVTMNGVVY